MDYMTLMYYIRSQSKPNADFTISKLQPSYYIFFLFYSSLFLLSLFFKYNPLTHKKWNSKEEKEKQFLHFHEVLTFFRFHVNFRILLTKESIFFRIKASMDTIKNIEKYCNS